MQSMNIPPLALFLKQTLMSMYSILESRITLHDKWFGSLKKIRIRIRDLLTQIQILPEHKIFKTVLKPLMKLKQT